MTVLPLGLTPKAQAGPKKNVPAYIQEALKKGGNQETAETREVYPVYPVEPVQTQTFEQPKTEGEKGVRKRILGVVDPTLPMIDRDKALKIAREACEKDSEIADATMGGIPKEAPAGVDQDGEKFTIIWLRTLDPLAPAGAYYAMVEVAVHGGTVLSISQETSEEN
jgi:hypothetical protein